MPKFPRLVSFTLTSACNLRCKMCGQWSKTGYYRNSPKVQNLSLKTWKKIVSEISKHKGTAICVRGGEPFLYPGIIQLLRFIKKSGIFVSIDTNGTLLERYAEDIVNTGVDNINVSVDGPQKAHDQVRGSKGSFARLKKGIEKVRYFENIKNRENCVRNIVFTASPYSYKALADMPEVAKNLRVNSIAVVPCYYFGKKAGLKYENIMKREFNCKARSWKGFYRERSGVNGRKFIKIFRKFRKGLRGVSQSPFMEMTEGQYQKWFSSGDDKVNNVKYRDMKSPVFGRGRNALAFVAVGRGNLRSLRLQPEERHCANPWKLADIQPDGSVNFCVDLPDYILGNVKKESLAKIWNNARANEFRGYIKERNLPVCGRCGAKFM